MLMIESYWNCCGFLYQEKLEIGQRDYSDSFPWSAEIPVGFIRPIGIHTFGQLPKKDAILQLCREKS